ncbi:MAG: hypothetical protein SFV81_08640 [Pirellulaceae bacterium]|nr:hypothetical protein [Pirellulaceae bacterium]
MDGEKGIHGWVAALTVGVTLTVVAIMVDQKLRTPSPAYYRAEHTADAAGATTRQRGIVLAVDPGLIATEQFPHADRTPLDRDDLDHRTDTAQLLRKPPEPAMQVVLRAPTVNDLDVLPLSSSTANIDYLMDAIDRAFESPIQTVAASKEQPQPEVNVPGYERLANVPTPSISGHQLPTPNSLLKQLDELKNELRSPTSKLISQNTNSTLSALATDRDDTNSQYISTAASAVAAWIEDVTATVQRLVRSEGLGKASGDAELVRLRTLSEQIRPLADELKDNTLAAKTTRIGYAIERRLAVWQAVSTCLQTESPAVKPQFDAETARHQIQDLLVRIEAKLPASGDAEGWLKYLKMSELKAWSNDDRNVWEEGNALAINVLSRLRWERLNESQRAFIDQPEFTELAMQLTAWARQPVDYRQLLTDLELLEEDPINRVRYSLASTVQVLRLADEKNQQAVASALNDHYRNANIRLAIAGALIERFLPEESYQTRPVHQRILGANTSGDSIVRTEMGLKLIPDESAWHITLGVQGDLTSATRSSKGPAVFHNSSQAQISSERTVRMDTLGFKVVANETDVESQQHLRGMSTDFDGLPIIGDFLRLVIREQFDQQRGPAKRIMHRMIAEEADQEFDKQLQEKLNKAQVELQRRLIGPLEALNLNPMVVAMSTTEDRLLIRYRVANQAQMASHTARPRAPSDSLLSMQVHQSAVNNMIAQLGLSDRTWNLVELGEKVASLLGKKDWKAPEDLPKDVQIRFAPSRPISVEMIENQLVLTLRISELSQGKNKIERFIVRSNYVPVADGLKAGLVRDGVVSIDGPRLSMGDRLPLRAIFAKVFVSRPEIPLISDSLVNDPRAQGLAVNQIEVRDGWLAIAVAEGTSPLAAEVAERSAQYQMR